ncbi:excalibur calcium-binding domain-containing protein [Yinghuangia sp. YIM S09857]|uniref:excalibur calcium-binding domain-containing protein n=1 Tax=Yinghuangia sp. YIM S09857 TaxID=3436929 RepID=UPI003F5332FD
MTYSNQPWGAPPPPPPPPSAMRQPWHTRTGWIVALLILFAPVGIFLLYRAGIWRGATRHIVAAVAGFVFLVVAIGSAAGDPKDEEADKPKEPAVVSTTPAAPSSSAPPPTTEAAAPVVATTAPEQMPTSAPPTTEAPPEPVETRPAAPPATRPAAPATTRAATPTTRRPTQAPAPTTSRPAVVNYANCAAVRAAGAAPIHRGDPGYDDHLDRDGDGIGCEN